MSATAGPSKRVRSTPARPPTRPPGARALPIYQTTSYVFKRHRARGQPVRAQGVRQHLHPDHEPDQDAVEQRIASLEGGVGAAGVPIRPGRRDGGDPQRRRGRATTSWPAPACTAARTTCSKYTLRKLGHRDDVRGGPGRPRLLARAVRPNTKLFFGETISNPKQDVLDIEGVAASRTRPGVPLIVDNTVATPYLIRPLEWGADIVVHSATKYLGGHGTSIGGVIVDGGTFDFAADPERFPNYNEPDPSYHGLVYGRDLGVGSPLGPTCRSSSRPGCSCCATSARRDLAVQRLPHLPGHRDAAACGSSGTWTTPRRSPTGCESRDEVASVAYAGLPSSPLVRSAAAKYAPQGAGAIVAFEIEGGREAGKRFVDALELHSHVANIGDVRSLVIHPASTTHSPALARGAAGRRRHAGPGPPLGRHRAHRRHPGRPRHRLPGGQERLSRPAAQASTVRTAPCSAGQAAARAGCSSIELTRSSSTQRRSRLSVVVMLNSMSGPATAST